MVNVAFIIGSANRLQAIRDRGDFEGWLGFFLRGVAEVSVKAATTPGLSPDDV
jgi:hypothetical protein